MTEMNLSQALREVKKIKGELADLATRAQESVSWKLGDPPAYSFTETLEEANILRWRLIEISTKIEITNAMTTIDVEDVGKVTLTNAIRLLRELKGQISFFTNLKGLVKKQKETHEETREYDDETDKFVKGKAQFICALPEAERAKKVDEYRRQFDKINGYVEAMNHRTLLK